MKAAASGLGWGRGRTSANRGFAAGRGATGLVDGGAPRPSPRRRRVGLCFFFQAEDGIRDYKVTGVQTCALPILAATLVELEDKLRLAIDEVERIVRGDSHTVCIHEDLFAPVVDQLAGLVVHAVRKIGRASCRERV